MMQTVRTRSIYSALRPWTFTAALTPVLLGAVLSFRSHGELHILSLIATLAAVLAVNGAGNLVNTYFDYTRELELTRARVDRSVVGQREGPLHENGGVSSGRGVELQGSSGHLVQMVNFAAYLYGSGMALLWLLMWLSPARSEHLAGLFFGGLSSSFIYTGGIGLKYYILGDLLVMLTFGPLSLLFSFVAQSGTFTWEPLLLALPLALSTETIVHCKHVREMEADRRAGVLSLAVLLGKQGSYFLFALLLFVPYLVFVIWGTQYSLALGLPLLTMPYAFQMEKRLREHGPDRTVSTSAAKLNVGLSLLFVVGCLLATDIPFITVQS